MHFPYYSNPYVSEFRGENGEHLDHRPKAQLLNIADGKTTLKPLLEVHEQGLDKIAGTEHSDALHPAQLYSTITAWLIAAVLIAYYTLPHVPGRVFAMMVIIESPTRYILEMLRSEPAVIGRTSYPEHLTFLPPQSFSMVLSVILFAVGIVLWFAFRGPKQVPGEPGFRPGMATAAA
jgi:prolipoprotein diacylglyceryltransferase